LSPEMLDTFSDKGYNFYECTRKSRMAAIWALRKKLWGEAIAKRRFSPEKKLEIVLAALKDGGNFAAAFKHRGQKIALQLSKGKDGEDLASDKEILKEIGRFREKFSTYGVPRTTALLKHKSQMRVKSQTHLAYHEREPSCIEKKTI